MSEVYDAFREAGAHRDVNRVAKLLADDVRLFASLTPKPFEGKAAVLGIFAMLLEVFEELQYVAEYDNSAGKVLLTTGRVGERDVDGVQVLTFGADGLVHEFRDFIRPFSGALALREAAEQYFARQQ